MQYIYRIRFKGRGSVIEETEEKALQKIKKQLNGLDVEYLDLIGREGSVTTPDQMIDEMQFLYNLTKEAYRFNARNTDYTDYSKGFDEGYLKGMEVMLEQMKGILYGNKNE